MCSPEGLLNFENVEYVVFYLLPGQGPASSLDCPAIDILEFLSTGNEFLLLTLRPIYLLPQVYAFSLLDNRRTRFFCLLLM